MGCIIGPWSTVHNRSSPSLSNCIFLHNILQINNAKLSVSSAWWPLNRRENNGRTIVGTAIKWPRPLDRGGCLILYSFLQLFRDFDFWPLNGDLWDPTVYVSFPVEQYQGPSTPINNEIGEGWGTKWWPEPKQIGTCDETCIIVSRYPILTDVNLHWYRWRLSPYRWATAYPL